MLTEEQKEKIREAFCEEHASFGSYCNHAEQLVENEKEIRILVPDTGDIPVSFNDLVWLKQFGRNVLVEATSDFMKHDYGDWPSSLLVIRIIK